MVSDTPDKPLVADADDIRPARIRGIEGARSYTTIEAMMPFAEFMGFRRDASAWSSTAPSQRALVFQPAARPSQRRRQRRRLAHIAYDAGDQAELQAARDEAAAGPLPWTAVFDHYFFDSCYTRRPAGGWSCAPPGRDFWSTRRMRASATGSASRPASSRCAPSSSASAR